MLCQFSIHDPPYLLCIEFWHDQGAASVLHGISTPIVPTSRIGLCVCIYLYCHAVARPQGVHTSCRSLEPIPVLIHLAAGLKPPCHVQAGKRPADISLGRYLADTVTGIPRFEAEEFENMLTDSTQDSLLVMYLSNLVRAHLALADRLGTSTLPLL